MSSVSPSLRTLAWFWAGVLGTSAAGAAILEVVGPSPVLPPHSPVLPALTAPATPAAAAPHNSVADSHDHGSGTGPLNPPPAVHQAPAELRTASAATVPPAYDSAAQIGHDTSTGAHAIETPDPVRYPAPVGTPGAVNSSQETSLARSNTPPVPPSNTASPTELAAQSLPVPPMEPKTRARRVAFAANPVPAPRSADTPLSPRPTVLVPPRDPALGREASFHPAPVPPSVPEMLNSASHAIAAGELGQARTLLLQAQTHLVFASSGPADASTVHARTRVTAQITNALASLSIGDQQDARLGVDDAIALSRRLD